MGTGVLPKRCWSCWGGGEAISTLSGEFLAVSHLIFAFVLGHWSTEEKFKLLRWNYFLTDFFIGNVCHLFFTFLTQLLNIWSVEIIHIEKIFAQTSLLWTTKVKREFLKGVNLNTSLTSCTRLPKKEDIENHRIDELYDFWNE